MINVLITLAVTAGVAQVNKIRYICNVGCDRKPLPADILPGEIQIAFPIGDGDVVLALAAEICRMGGCTLAVETVIDVSGGFQTQPLAFRIRPDVLACRAHEKRTGSNQGQKFVLVEGQGVDPPHISFEIIAEPVREIHIDGLHCLANGAS